MLQDVIKRKLQDLARCRLLVDYLRAALQSASGAPARRSGYHYKAKRTDPVAQAPKFIAAVIQLSD